MNEEEEEEEEKEDMEEVKREGTGGKGEWRAAKQERQRQRQRRRHSILCLQDRTKGQPKISAVKIRATDQQNLFLFQPLLPPLPFLIFIP